MAANDQALLDRWYTHRDAEAFKTIAQRHAGMVYSTCLRVLRNPTDAEDVAQECFEVLCSTRKRPNRNLASWLHTVATNRAINRIRAKKRHAERVSAYGLDKAGTIEIGWDDLYDLVDEVIAELPRDLSEPVLRHFFEDETHEDIARSLGVTRSAVTHRLHRAVERMRTSLQRRGVGIAGGALSVLLATNAVAEAAPQALTVNIAKLALAGPSATTLGAGAGVLAAKIVAACAVATIAGFAAWHVLALERPTSRMEADATEVARSATEPLQPAEGDTTGPPQPANGDPAAFAMAVAEAVSNNPPVDPDASVVTGQAYIVETGEPVPNLEIALKPANEESDLTVKATTNVDGVYRIEVPAPGEYALQRTFSDLRVPNTGNEPKTIRISKGQVLEGIDFPIVIGIRVSGICVDEQGNPISGAEVEGRDRDNYLSLESFITREDGRFSLAGFPRTPHFTLDAEVTGKLVSDLYGPVELTDGGLADVRLVLHSAATIEGTVVDPSGKPMAGIRVSTGFEEKGIQRYVGRSSSDSGVDGRFHIEGLAPGKHRLFLHDPKMRQLHSPATGPETIDLKPGDHIDGLRLVYQGKAVTGLTILGRVVDTQGNPIAKAEVRAHGSDAFKFTQSDETGAFEITGLPDTSVTIVAEHDDHPRVLMPDVAAGTAGLEIVMDAMAVLEGQVVDVSTGKPIEQFDLVHLDNKTKNQTGERTRMRPQVDPEGRFRIEGVAPGPVTVVVKADGYAESELEIDNVKPGETRSNLRIALSGGLTLTGTVQDSSGNPVANAYIVPGGVPNGMEPRLAAVMQTNEDGQFTLDNQPATLKLVSVYHEAYSLANVDVALDANRENTVTVTLSEGCTLAGGVTIDGEPAADTEVRIFFGHGPGMQRFTTKTDGDGAYRFDHLPAGNGFALTLTSMYLEDDTRITRWFSQAITVDRRQRQRAGLQSALSDSRDYRFGHLSGHAGSQCPYDVACRHPVRYRATGYKRKFRWHVPLRRDPVRPCNRDRPGVRPASVRQNGTRYRRRRSRPGGFGACAGRPIVRPHVAQASRLHLWVHLTNIPQRLQARRLRYVVPRDSFRSTHRGSRPDTSD